MKDGFWKINAFRPEIKAIKGKTRKFNLGLKSKFGRIGEPMEEFPFFLYIKAVWELKENGVTNWKQQTSAQNIVVVVRW